MNFKKLYLTWKIVKNFYETQTASRLEEVIQPLPNPSPSDKNLLCLWNKNFLTKIYRNIQTFSIKVLQEWGSWASRNGAAQMFCLTTKRNMYPGKFANSERFLAVLPEHIKFSVNWIEVRSMSKVFWGKLYCKMSDLFC